MFCRFSLVTILYNKVVPVMWSPLIGYMSGDHIKQTIACIIICFSDGQRLLIMAKVGLG